MKFFAKPHFRSFLCLFIGIAIGLSITILFDFKSVKDVAQTITGVQVRKAGAKFTNPLLECEVADSAQFVELESFKNSLQVLADSALKDKKASQISIYFRDLNNGPWIGVNEKEEFSPSSLLKVPLLMSYFDYAEVQPDILDEEVVYNGTFNNNEKQNIEPLDPVEAGKKYKILNLLEKSIIYSDNNAAKILSENIPQEYFFKPYQALSLKLPIRENGEYQITVKDYATFFRVLFNASFIDQTFSEKALEILSKSDFREGIVAGVPEGVPVAHKFGERIWDTTKEHQLHDCGIVYYPNKPYLLCIMTRGSDFNTLTQVLSDTSKLVYEKVDSSSRQSSRVR